MFIKILQYSQEKTCLFLFNSIRKDTLAQGFYCEFRKIFKNTFFTVPLWITASILQREKNSSVYLKDFTDLDFFCSFFIFSFIFFHFPSACLLFSYAKHLPYSEQQTVLLARRHINTMILTNFENLNSISNIFQKTNDFLVLTDPAIICIYLRTTDRDFRDQGNVILSKH